MTVETINRDYCVNLLRNNICVVTFTKRDGTERVMRCTLMANYLPSQSTDSSDGFGKITEVKTSRKSSVDSVSLWDMDKNAWRAFTVNSVKQIKQES